MAIQLLLLPKLLPKLLKLQMLPLQQLQLAKAATWMAI